MSCSIQHLEKSNGNPHFILKSTDINDRASEICFSLSWERMERIVSLYPHFKVFKLLYPAWITRLYRGSNYFLCTCYPPGISLYARNSQKIELKRRISTSMGHFLERMICKLSFFSSVPGQDFGLYLMTSLWTIRKFLLWKEIE